MAGWPLCCLEPAPPCSPAIAGEEPAMKKLIRAPFLTNALLSVIACELLLLIRRQNDFTVTGGGDQREVRLAWCAQR